MLLIIRNIMNTFISHIHMSIYCCFVQRQVSKFARL